MFVERDWNERCRGERLEIGCERRYILFGTNKMASANISPDHVGCEVCGVEHTEREEHVFIMTEEAIDEELLDPISFAPIFDGVQFPNSKCRHSFSRFTIERCLRSKRECPLCKAPISMSDIKPVSLMVSNILDKLRVYCPYDPSATHGTFKRGELSQHLRVCVSGPVLCPLEFEGERCGQQICRSELAGHMAACELRVVNCPLGCEGTLRVRDQASHNCLEFLKQQVFKFRQQSAVSNERIIALEQEVAALSLRAYPLAAGRAIPESLRHTSGLPVISAQHMLSEPPGVIRLGQWCLALCREEDGGHCSLFGRPATVLFFWTQNEGEVCALSFIASSNGWFNVLAPSGERRTVWSSGSISRNAGGDEAEYVPDNVVAMPATAMLAVPAMVTFGNWTFNIGIEEEGVIFVSNSDDTDPASRVVIRLNGPCHVHHEPSGANPFGLLDVDED